MNTPVVAGDGHVQAIIHHVIGVTARRRWRAPYIRRRLEPLRLEELPGTLAATEEDLVQSDRILKRTRNTVLAADELVEQSRTAIGISLRLLGKVQP
jgi:hypothetical protein